MRLLPGFGLQQVTNATPDAAILMYIWPAVWIVGLLFVLLLPRFEMLNPGGVATQGAMGGAR